MCIGKSLELGNLRFGKIPLFMDDSFSTMLIFRHIDILKFEDAMMTKLGPIKKNCTYSDLKQRILSDFGQQDPTYHVNHDC